MRNARGRLLFEYEREEVCGIYCTSTSKKKRVDAIPTPAAVMIFERVKECGCAVVAKGRWGQYQKNLGSTHHLIPLNDPSAHWKLSMNSLGARCYLFKNGAAMKAPVLRRDTFRDMPVLISPEKRQ